MKKIFTILTIVMGLVLPMQAQLTPVAKNIKTDTERKVMRKALASADVTIEDLAGTYEVYAMSAFQGYPDETWTATVTLDEADANKVWIQPILLISGLEAEYVNPVYATFNANDGSLSLPMGQCVFEQGADYNMVLGTSEDGRTVDTETNLSMPITQTDAGVTFEIDAILGVGNLAEGDNGWWYQALGYTVFTKEVPVPEVYIYCKGEETPDKVKTSQLFFNEIDGEMCVTTTAEFSNDIIAGTYSAYAESAFEGYPAEEWNMTITRDEADANKVWIHPILLFGGLETTDIAPVYATYDETAGTIAMPLGQVLYEAGDYRMVLGASEDGVSIDVTNDFIMVLEDNTITFNEDLILGVGNANTDEWWYQAVWGAMFTKEAASAYPLSEVERITREKPAIVGEYTFIKPGDYTWSFGMPVSETEVGNFATATTFVAGEMFDLAELFGDEAAGYIGVNRTITGFLEDLGLYEGGGEAYPVPAISYAMTLNGQTADLLSILDVDNYFCTIGKVMMQDETGNPVAVELMLGDLSEGQVYYPDFIATSEDEIVFAGEQLVLFYAMNNQAYLFSELYDATIAPTTSQAAPMRVKAIMGEKATFVGQGTPLQMNQKGFQMK